MQGVKPEQLVLSLLSLSTKKKHQRSRSSRLVRITNLSNLACFELNGMVCKRHSSVFLLAIIAIIPSIMPTSTIHALQQDHNMLSATYVQVAQLCRCEACVAFVHLYFYFFTIKFKSRQTHSDFTVVSLISLWSLTLTTLMKVCGT